MQEIFQWTGQPGLVGGLVLVFIELGMVRAELKRISKRLTAAELAAERTSADLKAHARHA